jgi:hypothetical protein
MNIFFKSTGIGIELLQVLLFFAPPEVATSSVDSKTIMVNRHFHKALFGSYFSTDIYILVI